jgi:hypothetical protein
MNYIYDPRKRVRPDPTFKAPTEAHLDAPDVFGVVEGWRTWKVTEPSFGVAPKLYSVTDSRYFWVPRQRAEAACDRFCGETPGQLCSCGFYSARTLEHLLTMRYHFYTGRGGSWGVVGRVANWGGVVPGDQGWRAQYSYPVVLYVPFEAARKLGPALSETYGVPVKMLNVLKPRGGSRGLF